MSFRTKFGDWAVRLRVRPSPPVIVVSHNGVDRKRTIKPDALESMGFHEFPTELRYLIQGDLKFANQYDNMMDKFYEWYDYEY